MSYQTNDAFCAHPHRSGCDLFVLFGVSAVGAPYVAPDPSRVVEMHAQLFNLPDGGDDIDGIEIPVARHHQILGALDGATKERRPMKWQILGRLSIVLDESQVYVGLFRTGGEVGAFRVDGSYYRGSSDAELIRLISESGSQAPAPGDSASPVER